MYLPSASERPGVARQVQDAANVRGSTEQLRSN